MVQAPLQEKARWVETILKAYGRVVVAYSGGVDSTLLAKLARDVLGKSHALAVTADSPSLAREDLQAAIQFAHQLDLEHRVIQTAEVEDALYRQNTAARCYVCKRELFERLQGVASREGISVVLYGAIGDDRVEERPGQRAALQAGVRAPLQDADLTKAEVRELARALGLPNWDRPQNACLSSRIPHGLPVDEETLSRVEQAERLLRGHGFRQVRVRHVGTHARIEVEPDEVARCEETALSGAIVEGLTRLGFRSVGVDREGYRPGGANTAAREEMPLSGQVAQ